MSAIGTVSVSIQQLPAAVRRSASLRHLMESRELNTARVRATESLQRALHARRSPPSRDLTSNSRRTTLRLREAERAAGIGKLRTFQVIDLHLPGRTRLLCMPKQVRSNPAQGTAVLLTTGPY